MGVPEICACCPSNARPAGNCPVEIDQVYGGVPPDAARVAVYACPTVPVAAGHAPIDTPAAIVIPRFPTTLVDALSLTVAENENAPTAEGVPEICPPAPNDNPFGSAPEVSDQV